VIEGAIVCAGEPKQ